MRLAMKLFSKLKDQRGAAFVEFALATPVLVLLAVGLAEFGLGYFAKAQVAAAAQTGLRYAYAKGFNSTNISSAVTGSSSKLTISANPAPSQFCGCVVSNAVVSSSCTGTNSCANGDKPRTYVSVSASATYTPLMTLPGMPASYAITSTAQGRLD
jgi:Flp pilus assembly protein TadG